MSRTRPAPVLGIIGGIGSGKSLVSRGFEEHGAVCINADALAHRALDDSGVKERIRARIGDDVFGPGGGIDRGLLGQRVFHAPEELEALEAIVHPWVETELVRELQRAQSDASVELVVLDVPLLLETGLDRLCDRILFVDADEETRLTRVKQNRGWDLDELKRREKFQKPLKEKKMRADYRIENNLSAGRVRTRIDEIKRQIVSDSLIP